MCIRDRPWLMRLGEVYTYDAPWHRGRDIADPYPISTERFVADLGDEPLGADRIRVGPLSWSAIRWAPYIRGVWPRIGPVSSPRWWSRTWPRTSAARHHECRA